MKMIPLVAAALAVCLSLIVGASPALASDFGSAASALPLLGIAASAATPGLAMTALERARGRFLRGPDSHPAPAKTAAELATETKAAFDASLAKVQELADEALGKAAAGEKMVETVKADVDEALTTLNEAKARLDDLEQKLARDTGRGEDGLTAGERFINDERVKAAAETESWRGRIVVNVKDITSLSTDADGSVGTLVQPTRAAPVPLRDRRMTIRALLAPGQTNSNTIEYDKEKLFTNSAAVVAEGAAKAQSSIQYEEDTATVRTIAHWMRASVQVLDDAPALRSMIDYRLRYGLAYAEEVELLTGDGTGQHLDGLITNASPYAAPGGLVADQMVDDLRFAILQVALAEYPANGIVLNPIDWAFIETMKDNEGRYLFGNPQGTTQARLWNLPVVATQAMTVDKFLVGAFDLAAQIFDRQNATVDVSNEDQDNFIKNKVTIRAEERLALAIYRPAALVYGDLGRV